MTTQLIPVFAGEMSGISTPLVDARLLHSFLDVSRQFANWIKERITEYGFIEGTDFLTNLLKTKGRPSIEYYLTLDMAKELAMVERNEKGRQARRYFIECERRLMPRYVGPQNAVLHVTKNELADIIHDKIRLYLEEQAAIEASKPKHVLRMPEQVSPWSRELKLSVTVSEADLVKLLVKNGYAFLR